MTQSQRILKYMKEFGSITPMQAFKDLGVTKLATRISEMKKEGKKFYQKYESSKNRYGEKVYFMKYALRKKDL